VKNNIYSIEGDGRKFKVSLSVGSKWSREKNPPGNFLHMPTLL
jgi:hypothetical protein